MEYSLIAISTFLISSLTLFSGFGLGTVLTPVFIIFFPTPIAISLTAIVHFINNIFKFFLLSKQANKEVIIKFGVPAILGAILGGVTLVVISKEKFIITYKILNHTFSVTLINLTIAILILFFILIELIPQINKLSFSKRFLPLGGVLSGFFGGLSGNQGAFRSIFLLKVGLNQEQFIATGVILACLIDFVRLIVYGANFIHDEILNNFSVLCIAVMSALLGSYLSKRYMHKVTIKFIKITVFILLFSISTCLLLGII